MHTEKRCLLIHSEKEDGQRFRPSDWVERISSSMARFGGDRRLRYDRRVHPVMVDGKKCLYVSAELARNAPGLFEHIVDFAANNRLRVEQERCQAQAA